VDKILLYELKFPQHNFKDRHILLQKVIKFSVTAMKGMKIK